MRVITNNLKLVIKCFLWVNGVGFGPQLHYFLYHL